jgi:uncharacterized protein with beta-barrel porin domain
VQNGSIVTCSPGGTGGFDAAGQDDLTVTVEAGAVVSVSVPDAHGISIANDSTVTIEQGTEEPAVEDGRIEVSADGAVGIWGGGGGDGNRVDNFGTISGIGDDAKGIVLEAGGGVGVVSNLGPINLTGDGAIGITAGDNAIVVNWNQGGNQGEIKLEGDNAVGIDIHEGQKAENWESIAVNGTGGVGVLARGSGNNIRNINGGTIEATGSGGIAVSLGVDGGSGNRLLNDSTSTITGGSGSGSAVSFEFSAAGDGLAPNEVDNSGSIVAGGGTALRGSDGVEAVGNYGTITGDVDLRGGDDGVLHAGIIVGDIDLGDGDDSFSHAGTITGDVNLGPGQDRFILYPAGSITGAILGGDDSDTFVLAGSTSDAFDLSNPPVAMTGFEALEINTSGTWTLSGSGGYAQGTTVVRGTVAMEDPVVLLDGDYTQELDATLEVVLPPEGTYGGETYLTVQSGDIDIQTGAKLRVSATGQIDIGRYYILETVGGSLTGLQEFAEGDVEVLSATLLNYEQGSDGGRNNLWIDLSYLLYADDAAAAGATPNQLSVANYVDGVLESVNYQLDELDPGFQAFLDAINPLDSGDRNAAYSQLSPEAYDAQTSAALSWGRGFTSVLKRRPLRCRSHVYQGLPDIRSESPCGDRGWMPWAEPLGQYAKRDGGLNYVSYDRLGSGLAVGADKRLDERWTVSGGLAVGRIGIDLGGLGNGTLTTFDLAAAGSLLLGPTHVRAVVSYGHGWHTTRRDLDFLGARFTGDHHSNRLGLLVEAGYEFELGSLRIEPLVEVDYTYIGEKTLAEEGAGAGSLRVDERSNSQVATAAGLRVSGTYYKYAYLGPWFEWLDGVITPELSARWRRVWTGADRDLKARMVGAPAAAGSFEVAADDASAGLEITARVIFQPQWTRNTVELAYDIFAGNRTTVHNLGAKLRIPF